MASAGYRSARVSEDSRDSRIGRLQCGQYWPQPIKFCTLTPATAGAQSGSR
jgi:hypothetical protein